MKIHGLHASKKELDLDNLSLNQQIILLEASRSYDKLKQIIRVQEEKIDKLKKKECISS